MGFFGKVLLVSQGYERVDVVFDAYHSVSIKGCTRERRKKGNLTRRIVKCDVPLPQDWIGFLSNIDNKSDLTMFLSDQIMMMAPPTLTVVVAGGYKDETEVKSNNITLDLSPLKATHKEADTRIILHCIHSSSENVIVLARDTDIFILLLAHHYSMNNKLISMKAGTEKKPKYVSIKSGITSNDLDEKSVKCFYHTMQSLVVTPHPFFMVKAK